MEQYKDDIEEKGLVVKILPLLTVVFAILLIITIIVFYVHQKRELKEDVSHKIHSSKKILNEDIEKDAKLLEGLIEPIVSNKELETALINKDRGKLEQIGLPIFNHLSIKYQISHFSFIDPERIIITRLHDTKLFGDKVNRYTCLLAEKTGKPSYGIELGMLGTFTLRIVAPKFSNNKLIGYIELGMDINHIVQRIKNTLEVEPYVLIKKEFLKQNDWESGMKMLGLAGDWNVLNDYVINNASAANVPESLIRIFADKNFIRQNIYLVESAKDKKHNIGYFPLLDASGKEVGFMVIADIYTHRLMDDIKSFSIASMISLFLVSLIILIFYKILSRIDKKLKYHNEQLESKVKEKTEQLQSTHEELKNFTYIVSHDLRTPLVNLTGFSSELNAGFNEVKTIIDEFINTNNISDEDRERLIYAIDKDIPESLNYITSSTVKINNMIDALLKFSRVGKTELLKEQLDINEIVKNTIKLFAHQIETLDIKITLGPLHDCIADKLSMEQIIGNLIDNAIKYRKLDRQLTLEIYSGQRADQSKKETIYYFKDNGIGIDEDKTKKIFEVFHRIENHDVQGDGLGLANLKALIGKHEGKIWCESIKDVGSTFIFTIPL